MRIGNSPNQPATASVAVNRQILARVDALAVAFRAAAPFRHVVIVEFLEAEVATSLLEAFPAFERGNARTENGTLGHKSTVERIRE